MVTKNCEPLLFEETGSVLGHFMQEEWDSRVGASVGHGQEAGAGVLLDEVLIRELLTVDGLTTGALLRSVSRTLEDSSTSAHVATGEVTTLEHELRDDAVEGRALVTETVLASAQLAEVAGGLGNDIVVEVEVDAALLDYCGVSEFVCFDED